MDPVFLTLDMILAIHADQIERYGGSDGLRDRGALESALAMPQAGIAGQYFHSDLFEMAAAYLFHVVKNHPFVDGNKRIGAMAAFVFLKLNGLTLKATEETYERLVLRVIAGKADKSMIAEYFRQNVESDR